MSHIAGKTSFFNSRFIQRNFCAIGLFAILIGAGLTSSSQNIWTQKADFGGGMRWGASCFSISGKGYIGIGYDGVAYKNDFWEYDPNTNSWSQKANFGGSARYHAAGFSIGNKGYIGTGHYSGTFYRDFWEYDPVANNWSQKADFGGSARWAAIGFSISSKGYLGTGRDGPGEDNRSDFWEYDPDTNTWSQKANYGGGNRYLVTGFSISNKGYIGTGWDGTTYKKDFWEYDPGINAWTQRADFGGSAREGATSFSIGSKGYIGTGHAGGLVVKNDFWEYDPIANTWIQKANCGSNGRSFAIGFNISSKGYIGTGYDYFNPHGDFWEYTPDNLSCVVPTNLSVTNITSSSAKLKWDEVTGAEGYKIRYKVSGFDEWTIRRSTRKSKALSNLSSNTSYTWEVKTYCARAPRLSSDWSPKQEFTTQSLRLNDESVEQISFQIYPNPASDKITVSFPSDEKGKLQIQNLLGQIVFSKEMNSTTEEIDVSKFPNGIYLIAAATATQKFERKFLKE